MNAQIDPRVIVALDFPSEGAALGCATNLDPKHCRVKVGKELFTEVGPVVVRNLIHLGFEIFLDLKYHDIPNTVAGAVRAAARHGVWMLNVHVGGGPEMLEAAANAVANMQHRPLIIGVTVLTSMNAQSLKFVGVQTEGIENPIEEQVKRLATLAKNCGLDGVVCSGLEISSLRNLTGPDFKLVVPGIRPLGDDVADQKRVMTPEEAIKLSADYLVIGRPITEAKNQARALQNINRSIKAP